MCLTASDKLVLRDDTIKHFREENLSLRSRNSELCSEVQAVSSERDRISRVLREESDQLRLERQSSSHRNVEMTCYQNQAAEGKERVEELVATVTGLQQRIVQMQSQFIEQIQSEESRRVKQVEKDKKEIREEMEGLYVPRHCIRCKMEYVERNNSPASCKFHPGRLEERGYPFEGFQWSCCQKRDKTALPCTIGGKHHETKPEIISSTPDSNSE